MAYTHKHWADKRHRYSKYTNLQNGIDLPARAFDGELSRTLSTWEWAELKEICAGLAMLDLPPRTLAGFIAIAGRHPTYLENGQWITPAPIQSGPGTMTAAPDGAHRHPEHESKLLTTGIGDQSPKETA